MKHTNKIILAILLVGLIFSFGFNPITKTSDAKTTYQPIKDSNVQADSTSKTVKIGEQTWMIRNLNVDHYKNGDPIPEVQDQVQWKNLKTGAWCYFDNDPENGKKYGKLYNWYAVTDPRGLAPEGWHIPTLGEFQTLVKTVNKDGNTLKAIGEGLAIKGGAGTNTSGFSALLARYRHYDGNSIILSFGFSYFWSSTEESSNRAYALNLSSLNSKINLTNYGKDSGFSIRCVEDSTALK